MLCSHSPVTLANHPPSALQLVDLRTGKSMALGSSKSAIVDSIATALDTQALVQQMQGHLAWGSKGGDGH